MKTYSSLASDIYNTITIDNIKVYEDNDNLCYTLEFDDENKLESKITKYLKKMYKYEKIKSNDSALVIGIGNTNSTPDSLGPKTIDNIIVTSYLKNVRKVYAISPNVMGNTGINTISIINALVKTIKPKFLIIIDALASSSIKRVNKVVEISNMGISPGSGVNKRGKKICKQSLHIPVISIGIPTVVDASTIVLETIKYLNISKQEINKILSNLEFNHLVTPKDIDFKIDKLSFILANSINKSLHRWLTNK